MGIGFWLPAEKLKFSTGENQNPKVRYKNNARMLRRSLKTISLLGFTCRGLKRTPTMPYFSWVFAVFHVQRTKIYLWRECGVDIENGDTRMSMGRPCQCGDFARIFKRFSRLIE